ncbi:hypothetical protein XPA_006072 [Xanthoria parietina]
MNVRSQVERSVFRQQTRIAAPVLESRLIPYPNPADRARASRLSNTVRTESRPCIRLDRPCIFQTRPINSFRAPASAPTRRLSRTMSSDDAYSSFLDQANQDTGATKSSPAAKTATTKAVDTEVPVELQSVEQYYTSEADEPFEPVSLQWDGDNLPSEKEFAELIGHAPEVTIGRMTPKEFDPQGQYKEVLQAVGNAGDGKSEIYRVGHGKTRVEYYIVGLDKRKGRVVGMKARAVES